VYDNVHWICWSYPTEGDLPSPRMLNMARRVCAFLGCERQPVPRFYFNICDGEDIRDDVGTEFADLASVRKEAVETTTEMLRGRMLVDSDTTGWIVQVTDEDGFTVMVLSLSASIHVLPVGSTRH